MGSYVPLSLTVEDPDDLAVVAACLQDALIPLVGIEYDPHAGDFRVIANRFCWECEADSDSKDPHHRVLAGITFHNVKNVLRKGFESCQQNELMNLLTIHAVPEENSLYLIFSGGSEIKVEIESLKCHLKDLEDPYPTSNRPEHV